MTIWLGDVSNVLDDVSNVLADVSNVLADVSNVMSVESYFFCFRVHNFGHQFTKSETLFP